VVETPDEQPPACWRRVEAQRVSLIRDAGPYYSALREGLEQAERSIFVVGWDIDGRELLLRGPPNDEGPRPRDELEEPLQALLDRLAQQRAGLEIRLLSWDYGLIYAFERQWLPLYNLDWRTHPRIRFQLDDAHPAGGSQHQKIVVIDDSLAFCGGIDLTGNRWDTPAHALDDPRRVTPDGQPYPPFHDVQIAVSGEAAHALGELARERWTRLDRRAPLPPSHAPRPLWPACLPIHFEQLEVSILRTLPPYDDHEPAYEIEASYLRAFAEARETIYIENQYLSADRIAEALAARLRASDGPEVLIIGPQQASGVLEASTMDVLRARVLATLREADLHGRLRVLYPLRREGDREAPTYVHAKVLIIDDVLLSVGSANLSTRSMRLDSECDLHVDARLATDTAQARHRATIRRLRAELLGEHLDRPATEVQREIEDRGSLIAAIDELRRDEGSTLQPLDPNVPDWLDRVIPEEPPFDPSGPLAPDVLFAQLVPEEIAREGRRTAIRGVALIAALTLLGLIWRALADSGVAMAPDVVLSALRATGPIAPLVVLTLVALAASLGAPLSALALSVGATQGLLVGLGATYAGALVAALLGFELGSLLGRRRVRRLAGSRLNHVSRGLSRGGLWGVIAVRLLPAASYGVVNAVIGASRVRLVEHLVGSAIGVLPSVAVLVLLGDRLAVALREPSLLSLATLVGLTVALFGSALLAHRWLAGRTRRKLASSQGDQRR
jgi:phospholipase D1/2